VEVFSVLEVERFGRFLLVTLHLSCFWAAFFCCVSYVLIKWRLEVKVKVKFTLEPATKDQKGSRRIALLFLTSALDGVGGQRHALAALPQGKTRYPLYRRLDGPQGRSGRVQKISPPPPGFDPRIFQLVASHYTDWATLVLAWRYKVLCTRLTFPGLISLRPTKNNTIPSWVFIPCILNGYVEAFCRMNIVPYCIAVWISLLF